MGCGVGGVLIDLGPHEFGRIEFWCAGRKLIHVKARTVRQKGLNLTAAMNRMLIPHQHDRTSDATEQVFEKGHHFVSAERGTIGLNVQLDLAFPRTRAQGADQVHALIVSDARTDGGSLPARCPGPFERRDERKPTFIEKNEGGAQHLPLFLYAARHSVSNGRSLHHRAAKHAVAVFGNSTPGVARDTRCRSGDSARETDPRSDARCDPRSSNLPPSRRHTPRARGHGPSAGAERRSSGGGVRVHGHGACVLAVWTPVANGAHSAPSCRSV